ncbi:MAG: L-lactate dehydrogenase [Clostridiales bacterium]|nr:L-lactate dehydrogenase [Clostridiales bacterium]
MNINGKKIVLVGSGFVGMSFAYAALNQNVCDEFVIIDIDKEKAKGEVMDLNHGLAFAQSNMEITTGEYTDCKDADIVVICAGVAQKEGETRVALLKRNAAVFESIIHPIIESGFKGIFLVASNPVDIMTKITKELSGFPAERVIGTGTTLDSARLRYLLGEYFDIDPKSVHAYVIGEHGDSEFIPWSQAMIGTKPIETVCLEHEQYKHADLESIGNQVRMAAYEIIKAKKATYYGIGMAIVRICKAILNNEKSILTISCQMNGEYDLQGVYLGMPCIVGNTGARNIIRLSLTRSELANLQASADFLTKTYQEIQADQ